MTLLLHKNTFILFVLGILVLPFSCANKAKKVPDNTISERAVIEQGSLSSKKIKVGAARVDTYIPLLKNKNVGVVANQTSIIPDDLNDLNKHKADSINTHIIDYLVSQRINVVKAYAPEHGFRGKADAGELIKDGVDTRTDVPIVSLYGKNKKPSPEQLKGIDIMVFDIQDVGARFYTYISTLHYVMEACAEANIPLLVLDRPNPNGHYVDGPILEPEHQSFVGMHPIPVVHGMTIGEYAKMINGEGWLRNKIKCELSVITMEHYSRNSPYSLPVKPSPNLPNDTAINLYPSLCFFEGTIVSAGRGTNTQFQVFGAPSLPKKYYPYQFTPQANEGAKYPKFKNERCNGLDLRNTARLHKINLEWLIDAYVAYGKKSDFFIPYFTQLAGTKKLQQQIEQGYTYKEIRATWIDGLEKFKAMRQPYLLYQ